MKAVVYERYGGPEVLRFAEVPTPVPGADEVLIRIHATTVNSADWRVRSLEVPAGFGLLSRLALGIRGPRQPILGTELSGVIARSKASLRDGGKLLVVLGGLRDLLRTPWVALTNSRRVIGGTATATAEDLRLLAGLAERGELKPVIDRTYRFDEIVEAHRYVDTGRKTGSVVITLEP